MKSSILVVCVLVLSACQDGGVGSGPLTLSPEVQAGFEKYMNEDSQLIFVVAADGRTYSYYTCPDPHGACRNTPGVTSRALKDCEKYSGGVPCKIYAKERNIVWEDAIHGTAFEPESNVLEPRLQQAQFLNWPGKTICERALSSDREAPNWDNRTRWREYVNEAKRRDLTPQSCAKLLGWNTVSPEKKPPENGDVEKRLTKLKNLFENGLITKDEYDKKRVKILEAL